MVGVDGHEDDDDEFEGREIPSRSDPAPIVGGTSLTGLSFSLQPRGGVTEDTDRLKKTSDDSNSILSLYITIGAPGEGVKNK